MELELHARLIPGGPLTTYPGSTYPQLYDILKQKREKSFIFLKGALGKISLFFFFDCFSRLGGIDI